MGLLSDPGSPCSPPGVPSQGKVISSSQSKNLQIKNLRRINKGPKKEDNSRKQTEGIEGIEQIEDKEGKRNSERVIKDKILIGRIISLGMKEIDLMPHQRLCHELMLETQSIREKLESKNKLFMKCPLKVLKVLMIKMDM